MSNKRDTHGSSSKKRSFKEHNSRHERDAQQLFGQPSQDHPPVQQQAEAEVDDEDLDHEEVKSDSEDAEGEDLDENLQNDYAKRPELDKYEGEGIDDEEQSIMDAEARRQAEREIDRLKQRQTGGAQHRQPAAFMSDAEQSESQPIRGQQRHMLAQQDTEEMQQDLGAVNDYSDQKENIEAWLQKPDVVAFIRKKFGNFLRNFVDENDQHTYEQRIQEMCQNNKQSIEVNFVHISNKQPNLAIWLAEGPAIMLPILNEVSADIVAEVYPDYHKIHSEIFVRIRDLPVEDKLRDLRQLHLNALVKFRGVVTKRSSVYPQYYKLFLRCVCGDLKGPTYHSTVQEAKVSTGTCIRCQRNGPYQLDEIETVYRNHQKLTIQETPGSVPPGRVPRQKECIVLHDLVDDARPGDEVEITGTYIQRYDQIANAKHGFPVFQTQIEVNNLKRFGDETIIELTDEDKQTIRNYSREPKVAQKIFNSVAPSIYGHDFIKQGLCMAMFGGEAKDIQGKHKIRGDINMLLLGDPGTAKSQFLKYIEKLYHRVVYTTGKGASAVGLTAGVHKDPVTQEWSLEGGALVLADRGICLIDEFDKMNEQDRTSIHEAMEQQSISISKAGIVTSLHARCSVIAAANPIGGIYKSNLNFNENVDLTDPILSRFDLLTVIRDEVTDDVDDALATFVLNSHMKSHPRIRQLDKETNQTTDEERALIMEFLNQNLLSETRIKPKELDQMPQETLRKYIMYAKRTVHPKLNDTDKEKVTQFYADIRRESTMVGGIPIAIRHLESILRMSEAYAKMHLRDYVRTEDIDFAIQMMLTSFMQSQKESVKRVLTKKFQQYLKPSNENWSVLHHELNKLVNMQAATSKLQRGVEELETIQVTVTIGQLKQEVGLQFENQALDDYFRSGIFRKEFRLEGDKIKCTRTM